MLVRAPLLPRASAEAPYHQSVDLGGGTTHGAGFQEPSFVLTVRPNPGNHGFL